MITNQYFYSLYFLLTYLNSNPRVVSTWKCYLTDICEASQSGSRLEVKSGQLDVFLVRLKCFLMHLIIHFSTSKSSCPDLVNRWAGIHLKVNILNIYDFLVNHRWICYSLYSTTWHNPWTEMFSYWTVLCSATLFHRLLHSAKSLHPIIWLEPPPLETRLETECCGQRFSNTFGLLLRFTETLAFSF